VGALGFSGSDYLLVLPITLLTLFALGILLIDLMLPPEQKWLNAVTALFGVAFSAAAIWNPFRPGILTFLAEHQVAGHPAMLNTMSVDRFAIYFWYLFLASTAIAILTSVRYLEIENESHGEYYALMLLSVAGMMCMASGVDVVLIFIGLELMAISTYVLVGFLRRDRRSNEAALKYLLLGAFSSGIFAYGLSLFYGLTGSSACSSRSLPSRFTSGRPTPTRARPPPSPDSCRSPSKPRDGPCCSASCSSDSYPCAPSGDH
jgi:NADH-quinone oxidoreductase subunit N